MLIGSPPSGDLREFYDRESSKLQQEFQARHDGLNLLLRHSDLIDSMLSRLWEQYFSGETAPQSPVALIALGDLGRRFMFPHSGIRVLFLHGGDGTASRPKSLVGQLSNQIHALNLRMDVTVRALSQVERFDPDDADSFLSLLNCRYLAGDRELFADLQERLIPETAAREAQVLAGRIAETVRTRHRRFANTVFHLEPNVKEGPGGHRDYVLVRRLALLSVMEKRRGWPEPGEILPAQTGERLDAAWRWLGSVRCFLHDRQGRDDNVLTWDAQDEAAAAGVGATEPQPSQTSSPAPPNTVDWMRMYFEHAQAVYRASGHLLEEMPAAQTLFYRQLETWRTGFSDSDFSVVDGLVFFKRPDQPPGAELLFRAFQLIAQHGFKLSAAAERHVEDSLAGARQSWSGRECWRFLQHIFPQPHAAEALRSMHALGLLTVILPEFRGINALSVRDYSHGFTVDEHTLQALENLRALRGSKSKSDERFAQILLELDQPELLDLAILLHDTGKAAAPAEPIPASLGAARSCLERFGLSPEDRETVLFLIERHLDLGAALRRDIFDPQTVVQCAENAGTPERLKMLALFTFVDIKALRPGALTPWKAEDLWQLYIATANYLNRSVDERVHAGADANDEVLNHLRTLTQAAGKKLETFLEGFPRRYLRTHPVDDILRHYEMAQRLGQSPVQLALKRSRHWYELTLVTKDRPFLFATMAGVLASAGMDIGKAGAFSNQSGTVADTFFFTDPSRSLGMNLGEWERFKGAIHAVLLGKQDFKALLRDRVSSEKSEPGRPAAETQIQFDDQCSAHSTLIELIAQDQPGLLYRISSVFAQNNCSIDIALIDTENQTAVDVFYLTSGGAKLTAEQQQSLRQALLAELRSP